MATQTRGKSMDIVKKPAKKAAKKPVKKPVEKPEEEPKLDLDEELLEIEEKAFKKPMLKDKKKAELHMVSIVFAALATIINVVFLYRMLSAQVLPAKYAYPLLAVVVIMTLFYIFKALRKKTHKAVLVVLNILAVIISAALLFATVKINEVFSFLSKNMDNKQYAVYDVIVSKSSPMNSIDDAKNKEIITYNELVKDVSDDKLKSTVSEKIPGSSLKFLDEIEDVFGSIVNNNEKVVIVNDGTYSAYIENMPEYAGKVKIIGTIELENEEKIVEATKGDITNTPFVIYISGIDTRTGTMPTRSLSDVNITAVINPNTKHVQLISIPRDSYVQLHGTSGLKDKLTHAGSKGGVKLSQATLEDLYGIKYDRYIRVNFNFVKKLVDAVGGITINSDVDYTFTTKHENCTIKPGLNNINGKCAIGFSRERYAYKNGDRHRGENQLQVIEKVFAKATNGSTILSKYSQILESLNGTFDSNIAMEDITSLVRMQLDDMAKWKIESFSVTGKGAMSETYSYPRQKLYVMHIDAASLETAKKKIQSVLAE